MQQDSFKHISVLSHELLAGLQVTPGKHYLDATVGGGGHSEQILSAAENVRITAIDRDPQAIAAAKIKLANYYPHQIEFWQGNYAEYQPQDLLFDGIIADLGVSSPQLDNPARGFSFRYAAPLDMRMDSTQSLTAEEIINHWQEKQLADIFFEYGEERFSRRIARNIVRERPFQDTLALANNIARAVPAKYRYGKINPATRVFQALRIAVNQELASLADFLSLAPHWLKPDGIMAIISFHSLEDRLVKHSFRDCELLRVLTKKPITAQPEEQKLNPRSRSAKLRLAQRILTDS